MEWFAFFVIFVMLAQHWEIQRRVEHPGNWERTLLHYRRTVLVAFILSALFVFASVLVFLLDLVTKADIGIIDQTKRFFYSDKPVSVLIIAFFVGIARLFAERALDTKGNFFSGCKEVLQSFFASHTLRRDSSIGSLTSLGSGSQRDAWFFWLCFSLGISVLDAAVSTGASSDHTQTDSDSDHPATTVAWFFAGIGASIYIAIGYFLWVYMTLYLKLIQHHHFTGRAARLFLGRMAGDQLPRQCTIIGPSFAGKTVLARQGGTTTHNTTDQAPHVVETTSKVDIRTAPVASDEGVTLNLTTLDTPGENMGDHILLASTFRSDVLVFVLDLGLFDPKSMENGDNYSLVNWHKLICRDLTDQPVKSAVNYMQGFHLATSRSEGDEFVPASELFKVRAFTLFLNRKEPEVMKRFQPILESNAQHLELLARNIGRRFGVDAQNCCCIAGDANSSLEGFQLLARSTASRVEKAVWPGRPREGAGE